MEFLLLIGLSSQDLLEINGIFPAIQFGSIEAVAGH